MYVVLIVIIFLYDLYSFCNQSQPMILF